MTQTQTLTVRPMAPGVRARWIYDNQYTPPLLPPEDPVAEAAADQEAEALRMGTLAALGCIIERRCTRCGGWTERDSLFGIVLPPQDAKLDEFARDNLDCSADPEAAAFELLADQVRACERWAVEIQDRIDDVDLARAVATLRDSARAAIRLAGVAS